MGIGFVWGDAV